MAQTHVDPENQGLASALLMGAMQRGDLMALTELTSLLLERNVRNLPVLYKLAQKAHPNMPTWEQVLARMDEMD